VTAVIKAKAFLLAAALVICCTVSGRAETPEEWVKLGARALQGVEPDAERAWRVRLVRSGRRLDAEPRGVTVVYYSGPKAPCPCPADGIAIATMASAGQGTLQVAPEKAPEDMMGVAVIRSKATGAGLKYSVAASWIAKLIEINKTYDPMGRYDAVMKAADLFSVEPLPALAAAPK